MKRLVVFAHFNYSKEASSSVMFFLSKIRGESDRLVFVSTSEISSDSLVYSICDKVIIRKNMGYDFESWRIGLIGEDLTVFDEVVLCNDSCFGPVNDLGQIFRKMVGVDFWGITASYEIKYHIQSYFMVFSKKVFESSVFLDFLRLEIQDMPKSELIEKYEIGLSSKIIDSGFAATSWAERKILFSGIVRLVGPFILLKKLKNREFGVRSYLQQVVRNQLRINLCHEVWWLLIIMGAPFIKRELVRDNPLKKNLTGMNLLLWIKKYPFRMRGNEFIKN